jgi:hypothetical protein
MCDSLKKIKRFRINKELKRFGRKVEQVKNNNKEVKYV